MKTLTPDRSRTAKPSAPPPRVPGTWEDFACVYPIYEALTKQCGLPPGPYPMLPESAKWPANRDRDLRWLDEVDQHAQAVHLRHFLATPAAAREEGLRLLLQRQLSKPEKLRPDRDKIDLLIVQYFVLCCPQDLIAGRVEASDVANVLQPVLGDVKLSPPESCGPLDRILNAAQQCRRLRDFMEQGLLEQGRLVKESIGEMFYDPAALIWIARFNFLLRRSFIQLIHEDLRAMASTLKDLDRRQVRVVDCRRAGLSTEESIANLRQFVEHWKLPFQTDYSRNSAFRPYEQLMSLREDLEDALNPVGTSPVSAPASGTTKSDAVVTETEIETQRAHKPNGASATAPSSVPATAKSKDQPIASRQNQSPPSPSPTPAASSSEQAASAGGALDVESLEEKIWEQLIATPPTRGRSMTTVTLDQARILLSAWEVAAFVSESGNDSDELRRVIVARAMLSTAIDRRKRFMDFRTLQQAVAHARAEVPRFQERVDQLKRNSKTDGAVNLGISLKRLLSLVEEAELLQKGKEGPTQKR